jgi:hypothetical protein
MSVCTREDDFTRGRFLSEPRWVATLTDGTDVISDDGRPGTTESAWQRLRRHCLDRGVGVAALRLQFRSHVERPVPPGAAAYFFKSSVMAFLNRPSYGCFLVGHAEAGADRVLVQRWVVPALVKIEEEWRPLADEELVGKALIRSY